MKKIYVIVLTMMLCKISATAQLSIITSGSKMHDKKIITGSALVRHNAPQNTTNAVVWSDDFSNQSNWVMTHDTGTTGDWIISFDGPSGVAHIDAIQSASAANGFALFDSDTICSGNQIANLTTVNPIDLTGHPMVRLDFSQYYARYYDSTYVFVSTDNVNWTKFEVNGNLTLNQFSANNNPGINPDIVSVDITSAAANQATVYIRFQFYSPSSIDPLAGCGYSWMIDDVSISDISTTDAAAFGHIFGGEYSVISLLNTEAFNLSGKIVNTGLTAITAATLTFNVYNSSGQVYTDAASISAVNLNAGDTSLLMTSSGSYAPVDTGLYIIEQIASVSGDGDGSNDTSYAYVFVDDSTNARDYTALDPGNYFNNAGFDNGVLGRLGQTYHIYKSSQLTSGTFYLEAPTLNDRIKLLVYDIVGGMPATILDTSAIYTITAADTSGGFITLPFMNPINVTPGDYFLAIDQMDPHNIRLGTSRDIYTQGKTFYNGGSGWNDVGIAAEVAFILRLNNPSSTLVGISDLKNSEAFTVFPNPSNGQIFIANDGVAGKVIVNVINSIGKVVKSYSYSSLQNEKIDLSKLSSGSYTIQFISGNEVVNKKVVLNK